MKRHPVLSVIVPAYNVQRFIEPCIGSVLQQLEAHDELIVIDDGSTDGTPALLDTLRREHRGANFRIISQANQGIAATRNAGIAAACGDYIVFVDGDDLLRPGALAALASIAATHKPDVIACDFNMWRPDNERKSRPVVLGYRPEVAICDREEILSTFFADRHMYVWANVVRREVYLRLAAPIFPPQRAFEDVAVLSRVLNGCASLYHLPLAIIDYRQHPASITKVISEKWCLDFAAALLQVSDYFRGQAVSDAIKLQIDATACWFYIGIVKNSYQLPWAVGRDVRAKVKAIFIDSLFNEPEVVLAAMCDGTVVTHARRRDAIVARQVGKALAGSLVFDIAKAASRQVKFVQRMRRSRVAA
jgi:glycosyltransferase involved in cell wall biosynthesis